MSPRRARSLVTHSEAPAIDGRRATFTCIANRSPNAHSALRIDQVRPRRFVLEDGAPFLPIDYECDWLWALDAHDPKLPTLEPFLDKIAAHGSNFVRFNAYAHDTTWRKGHTGDDDLGPPPGYACAGTNDQDIVLSPWSRYGFSRPT